MASSAAAGRRCAQAQVDEAPGDAQAKVRVYADNAEVGRTPATLTAGLSAVKVMMSR
jgi:hypothetical protein